MCIRDRTKPVVIGTMDRRSAPTLIFPDAIYFHGGKSYIVESLDTEKMPVSYTHLDVYKRQSDSGFMQSGFRLQSELGTAF